MKQSQYYYFCELLLFPWSNLELDIFYQYKVVCGTMFSTSTNRINCKKGEQIPAKKRKSIFELGKCQRCGCCRILDRSGWLPIDIEVVQLHTYVCILYSKHHKSYNFTCQFPKNPFVKVLTSGNLTPIDIPLINNGSDRLL